MNGTVIELVQDQRNLVFIDVKFFGVKSLKRVITDSRGGALLMVSTSFEVSSFACAARGRSGTTLFMAAL